MPSLTQHVQSWQGRHHNSYGCILPLWAASSGCLFALKGNPQMLNRSETDENPYNICLTSADKLSQQFRRCSASHCFCFWTRIIANFRKFFVNFTSSACGPIHVIIRRQGNGVRKLYSSICGFFNKMLNIGVKRVVLLSNVWSNRIKCLPLYRQIPLASHKNSVPSGTFFIYGH